MTRLRIAVVGVGAIGKRHAENLRACIRTAELVAVADADMAHARQVASELEVEHAYEGLGPILERKDIQAVVISSPSPYHAGSVQLAAQAGKHILCEKPLGMTLEEADAAIAEVARAGVVLQVGHMRRFDPAYTSAKERVATGEIGTPVIFKSIGRDPESPAPSYFQNASRGLIFLESAIHDFDLARWFMEDEVAEVYAIGGALANPALAKVGQMDASLATLRYANGAIGSVENFWGARYGYDIRTEIVGTRATLQIGFLGATAVLRLTGEGAESDIVGHWLKRFEDAYRLEMADFVECLLTGRSPRVSGHDGRQAVAIALAAERSTRDGSVAAVRR